MICPYCNMNNDISYPTDDKGETHRCGIEFTAYECGDTGAKLGDDIARVGWFVWGECGYASFEKDGTFKKREARTFPVTWMLRELCSRTRNTGGVPGMAGVITYQAKDSFTVKVISK